VLEYGIDTIIHNASLLSAVGELNPQLAIRVNTRGVENVLEVARQQGASVFAPSTIAVFGPTTPRDFTSNDTIMRPTTIYGVTKIYLELLGEYYHNKYGLDFRSMRYPGIVSSKTMPGGGTTDYAVAIFYEALKSGKYTSFLSEKTALPMMYMPDCLKATKMLLEAPCVFTLLARRLTLRAIARVNRAASLTRRVYNITSMSFTPEQLAAAIQKELPSFEMSYKPDFRQAIADTWPASLDDSDARKDWGWKPSYDIDSMARDMLRAIREKMR